MTLDTLIEKFEHYISIEKNLSLHTRRNYISDLNQLKELRSSGHILDFSIKRTGNPPSPGNWHL